ncbi:MAG: type I-U CRISPR-associated protein Cas5/Cas6 [Proteobacteria bacterium]|nr:MAG: type I-U CRISPR-associated protein Cas5/Cas6 [Pseudomonadota bacterium]
MLTVEVDLLTGRYAATAHDDRRRSEWPPHPARFFSALVAALHDRDPVDDEERVALLWLERQPPPWLEVDLEVDDEFGRRDVHDVFVPVNDVSVVGDVWPMVQAVVDARSALAMAETGAGSAGDARAVKAARKALAAAEKKLALSVSKALTPTDSPSKVDLAAASALMPDRRIRQMRTFPVAVPARGTFSFAWQAQPEAPVRASLDALCARVTRLGHSSSLVRCRVTDHAIEPTLVPTEDGEYLLRVVGEGQLARLEAEFEWHREEKSRVLPARPQRYGPPMVAAAMPAPRSVFTDDWILYERRGGARPLSSRGVDVARALRAALIEANGSESLPDVLSGHDRDGRPSDRPHVAFVPCPFVGHPHGDGTLQGCAIVLPRDVEDAERRRLLRLIAAWERRTARDGLVELAGERLPPLRLARVQTSDKLALSPARWSRRASRFITATPIALDRHPGNLRSNASGTAHRASIEAQRTIADACERIGLPRPISVEIGFAPLLPGAQHVREFRPWPDRPGRPTRARVHAEIRFDQAVRGPVLLGAGRYFGLGLCLPVFDRDDRCRSE